MLHLKEIAGRDLELSCNFEIFARERGKIVPGTRREGHNVFTITGRNWLSKLIAWNTIQGYPPGDVPYTHRRVRWIGVGVGAQFEVTTVSALNQPVPVSAGNYLTELDHGSTEFPTSTSIRFIREFGSVEISTTGTTVYVSEAGLFVDVTPYDFGGGQGGSEDAQAGVLTTTLDPQTSTNPPIVYKTFEAIPKTQGFTLEIRWELRF